MTTETRGCAVKIAGSFNRPASAYATITAGAITSITVTDGGAGWTGTPTITVTGAYVSGGVQGSGCTATATIASGVITAITVTAPGSNYSDSTLSHRAYYDSDGEKRIYALSDVKSTTLANNLGKGETEIQVTDVNKLPKPHLDSFNSSGHAVPGVIFVGTERIEYFDIDVANNKLLLCRRGTHTTADQAHTTGTNIHGITETNTLTSMTTNFETMWAPHSTGGLTNSSSMQAEFLKQHFGTALT